MTGRQMWGRSYLTVPADDLGWSGGWGDGWGGEWPGPQGHAASGHDGHYYGHQAHGYAETHGETYHDRAVPVWQGASPWETYAEPSGYPDAHQTYGTYGPEFRPQGTAPFPAPAPMFDGWPADRPEESGWPADRPEERPDVRPPAESVAEPPAESPAEPSAGPSAEPSARPVAGPPRGRARRRSPVPRPRARSAFFSVAAPSLAFLGVTAVATAATVSDHGSGGDRAAVTAQDSGGAAQAEASSEFDTQLAGASEAAGDYADRASRTQGQIDLEEQQEREEQEEAEEAARREAARPKYSLPVDQKGISAYYGESGVNWMSVHTGIDFPVSYGTPVKAATDGYITTQWDASYGNVVILTADDGTETWYAHLDSAAYTSGYVQAGTVIAYSGNSGNSTGPHLHFEVRTASGSTIDPLDWLREHGLDPT